MSEGYPSFRSRFQQPRPQVGGPTHRPPRGNSGQSIPGSGAGRAFRESIPQFQCREERFRCRGFGARGFGAGRAFRNSGACGARLRSRGSIPGCTAVPVQGNIPGWGIPGDASPRFWCRESIPGKYSAVQRFWCRESIPGLRRLRCPAPEPRQHSRSRCLGSIPGQHSGLGDTGRRLAQSFPSRSFAQSSSPNRSKVTLPPVAAVLIDKTRSLAKRLRYNGPPALGPVPDKPCPPKGCTPTTAPIMLRFT